MWVFFFCYPQIIQKPSHDLKQQLANYSKRVAGSVTELIQAAEAMKGILTFDFFNNRITADKAKFFREFFCASVYI